MDQANGVIRTIATAEDPSLVRCFRGHEKSITSVYFAKDMKQVVSGGTDGLVEVWNFKPQIRPFKFAGHKGPVNDVLFNSSSTQIFSCGDDRQIKIWKNSVNGKNKSVKAHSGPVLKLSLSQSEKFFVSCSSDKTIKMWNSDGKFKQSYLGHTNWVRQCQISPDQRMLLSCSDDRTVKIWDIQKAITSASFSQHKSEVLTSKFTPDGTCIAGGAIDGTIKIWDTRISKMIQHYNAHDKAVNKIQFHPLGCNMASVSDDNKIKIWDLKHGTLGWTLYGHEGQIKTINFNEKGDYFATGGQDKLVMIWMSNFDKQLNEKGRKIETNFRQKSTGQGLQPLFKSNKIAMQEDPFGAQKPFSDPNIKQHQSKKVSQQKGPNIGELMSFELQKIVNQLEIITKSLDFMDKHVTEHEQMLERITMNEKADEIMTEMENNNLMKEEIYNSAWQAEKNMQPHTQFEFGTQKVFHKDHDQDLENQQMQMFLRQEQQLKKRMFQQRLQQGDQIEFDVDEVEVMRQHYE